MSFISRSVSEIASAVARGEVSAEEIARASIAAIESTNADLGAFLTVSGELALEQARAVDQSRARGEKLGKLAGVPVGLKDALCTRGVATTCASQILMRSDAGRTPTGTIAGEAWRPPYDATVVTRLKAAGAILPGKCNMDEFAMGSSSENSAFMPVKNPWDRSRAPGGSSGGSAVAVAARMMPAALGSDTGGSIRQPASFTNVVGVKPTYGRVSRYGLVAFASSLDQIGPFASDVRGAARILEVIAGLDPHDATSIDAPVGQYEAACERSVRGLRIGVPDEYFAEGLDPEIAANVRAAIEGLEREGCTIKPIKLPHTQYAVATYYVLATAEASANLARFDGVRFGLRVEPPRSDLATMYGKTRGSRLRRRGEATHHARHVRALGRLLRRVLLEGAARAHAHPSRLRARLPRGRRHRLTDLAGSPVPARRAHGRSAGHVPGRHLHAAGEPRRGPCPLGAVRADQADIGSTGVAGGTAACGAASRGRATVYDRRRGRSHVTCSIAGSCPARSRRVAPNGRFLELPRCSDRSPEIVLGLPLAADPTDHPCRVGDESHRHGGDAETPGKYVGAIVNDREREPVAPDDRVCEPDVFVLVDAQKHHIGIGLVESLGRGKGLLARLAVVGKKLDEDWLACEPTRVERLAVQGLSVPNLGHRVGEQGMLSARRVGRTPSSARRDCEQLNGREDIGNSCHRTSVSWISYACL